MTLTAQYGPLLSFTAITLALFLGLAVSFHAYRGKL